MDVRQHAAFEVQNGRMGMHGTQLVIDNSKRTTSGSFVVEVGCKTSKIWTNVGMSNPEVKIKKLRMILFDDFSVSGQPVARKLRADIRPVFEKVVLSGSKAN